MKRLRMDHDFRPGDPVHAFGPGAPSGVVFVDAVATYLDNREVYVWASSDKLSLHYPAWALTHSYYHASSYIETSS